MSLKRPHDDGDIHPDSPDFKRHLSEGLAALRITPKGTSRHPHPALTNLFGGAQSSAFLGGTGHLNPHPDTSAFANLSSLSNRLEDGVNNSDAEGRSAVPSVDSRALVLYREPPRPRRSAAIRLPTPMVVNDEDWLVRHGPHQGAKRRLLAMVPYRPTRRRLLPEAPLAEDDEVKLASLAPAAHVGFTEEPASDSEEVEESMEVDEPIPDS
jgi:hypothetical protein